ncbi:protamine-like [Bacillus rossius redtenbacheri]|uniref:protamine-like n=1 Tax=Bacillus rossius redtenbacheri TaxID=93214 RepID=UPI002FDD4755
MAALRPTDILDSIAQLKQRQGSTLAEITKLVCSGDPARRAAAPSAKQAVRRGLAQLRDWGLVSCKDRRYKANTLATSVLARLGRARQAPRSHSSRRRRSSSRRRRRSSRRKRRSSRSRRRSSRRRRSSSRRRRRSSRRRRRSHSPLARRRRVGSPTARQACRRGARTRKAPTESSHVPPVKREPAGGATKKG